MSNEKRYSLRDFDIDALASQSKLSLNEEEKKSFLADVCEMANYTHEALMSESADGTLAVCAREEKKLCELREDICVENGTDLMAGAPEICGNCFFVPRAVKGGAESEQ